MEVMGAVTYQAFGSEAAVEPMTGYDRLRYGVKGWYAVYFSFPTQPEQSFTDRHCRTPAEVLTLVRTVLARGDQSALSVVEGG